MKRLSGILGASLCWLWLGAAGCAEVDRTVEPSTDASQGTMPAALRAAWIRRVQNDAGPEYAIARSDGRRLEARHPRQNLRTRFNSRSVELSDRDGGTPLRMTLSRINGHDPGVATVSNEGNRVTMSRPGIDEWYVHGPMGLEQGFTIPAAFPTGGAGGGALRLAIAMEGTYRPTKRGSVIVWSNGLRTLETRELYAFDADGKQLAAAMRATRTELTIDVQTAGARYPIVIDPLWVEQQKLVAITGASVGWFGHSVSVSGDTAVIGMPRDETNGTGSGSAHVFVWSGLQWEIQQDLRPSDSAAEDEFGISVSVDTDTIVVGAYRDDDNGSGSGSAYVFVRDKGVWTQQQKLAASGGGAGDQFGISVSLDADTAVIGAPYNDDLAGDAGASYVFVRSGTVWSEQQKLIGWNSDGGDYFGSAVSVDGDTAIIGTPNDDDGGSGFGSAFVFVRSGTNWSAQRKLLAPDGGSDDGFGSSVAVEGDTAVVGAPADDDNGADSGSAYVFVRNGTAWSLQQKLLGSGGAADDQFGHSVDISGESTVVGARGDDEGAVNTGSTYVFVRSGTVWSEQQKLRASGIAGQSFGTSAGISGDRIISGAPLAYIPGIAYGYERSGTVWTAEQKIGPAGAFRSDQYLGSSVSISGDTAVIGAPGYDHGSNADAGLVYVFIRNGNAWTEQQGLFASDGSAGDRFGTSVGISGDTLVVGASYDDDVGSASGSVYVFVRSGSVWAQQQKLVASDGAANDFFGNSLSISGDTVVVGSSYDDDLGSTSGSVYVFVRTGSVWTEQQKLLASDGAANDRFGVSVSLSGGTVAVGSFWDDDAGGESGSAYVFTRSGAVWTEEQKLVPLDGAASDQFGGAVAVSGDTLVACARLDDGAGVDAGSAYVFTRSGAVWTEQQELFASDGLAGQELCTAVGVDGDTVLVGASRDTGNGSLSGAAYVFVRNGSLWTELNKVQASDGEALDEFGFAVGLSADTAVIGARGDDDRGPHAGAAYVVVFMLENGDVCATNGQCLSDLCDPTDLVCACADAGDCLINETCDTTEAPNACEPVDTCGNGAAEAGETCDDGGTVSGDGCSATCFVDNQGDGSDCSNGGGAACASGVCDASETPDTCEPADTCGNGAVETGEACDDGNVTSGDDCSATCFIDGLPIGSDCTVNGAASCASGVCDASESPDVCEPANACGNGAVEASEACDDGNVTSGDGCSATCFADNLPNGSECTVGGHAACLSGLCDTTETPDTCEAPDSCGNAVLEAGETCDDGNTTSGDGCSATCFADNLPIGTDCSVNGAAACASGVCDVTGVPAMCEPAGACGNGLLEFPEACDDGNTLSGDGCSMICFLDSLPDGSGCNLGGDRACLSGRCDTTETPDTCEPADTCGNGLVEAGEACDDGNRGSGDGCSAFCFIDALPTGVDCSTNGAAVCASGICDTTESPATCEAANSCGNSVIETGEACDDGGMVPGDGCSPTCFVEDQPDGSDCTVGGNATCASNLCDTTESPATCEAANSCGNGVVERGEVCDDGNTASGDSCDTECMLGIGAGPCDDGAQCGSGVCNRLAEAPVCAPREGCGNGLTETKESCDDGNLLPGDGCSQACEFENGWRGGGGCAVSTDPADGGQGWLLSLIVVGMLRRRGRLRGVLPQ